MNTDKHNTRAQLEARRTGVDHRIQTSAAARARGPAVAASRTAHGGRVAATGQGGGGTAGRSSLLVPVHVEVRVHLGAGLVAPAARAAALSDTSEGRLRSRRRPLDTPRGGTRARPRRTAPHGGYHAVGPGRRGRALLKQPLCHEPPSGRGPLSRLALGAQAAIALRPAALASLALCADGLREAPTCLEPGTSVRCARVRVLVRSCEFT
jgi:hypothetical protein